MQQMYDLWLSLTNQNRRSDGPLMTPPPEEKQNAMPADYTESVVGNRPTDYFQRLSYNFDETRNCTLNVDQVQQNPMKDYADVTKIMYCMGFVQSVMSWSRPW